jgi:hypothetical protein
VPAPNLQSAKRIRSGGLNRARKIVTPQRLSIALSRRI